MGELLSNVPCHAEFIKYIQWHNMGFRVVDELAMPAMVLRYENYEHDFRDTVKELMNFLGLPLRGIPAPFQYVSYPDYYSPDMKLGIKKLFKKLASEETWEYMKVYMPSEETES